MQVYHFWATDTRFGSIPAHHKFRRDLKAGVVLTARPRNIFFMFSPLLRVVFFSAFAKHSTDMGFLNPSHEEHACSFCGKRSSFRAPCLQDNQWHEQIYSRSSCVEVKSFLRKVSKSSTFVVEIHHFHPQFDATVHPREQTRSQSHTSELNATSPRNLAELPDSDLVGSSVFQGPRKLPTIFEEPPYVNLPTKPSVDEVRERLSQHCKSGSTRRMFKSEWV